VATLQLDEALDDNLDMQRALAAVQRVVIAAGRAELTQPDAEIVLRFLAEADAVLGILHDGEQSGLLSHAELAARAKLAGGEPAHDGPLDDAGIAQLLAARYAARQRGDYQHADSLRRGLLERGVSLEDAQDGVRWRRA
jgi:cysteinyl-tRNA synthetase